MRSSSTRLGSVFLFSTLLGAALALGPSAGCGGDDPGDGDASTSSGSSGAPTGSSGNGSSGNGSSGAGSSGNGSSGNGSSGASGSSGSSGGSSGASGGSSGAADGGGDVACQSDAECNDDPIDVEQGRCRLGICVCNNPYQVQPSGRCGGTPLESCNVQQGTCQQEPAECPEGSLSSSQAVNASCGDLIAAVCCFDADECRGPEFVCVAPNDGQSAPLCVSGWRTCQPSDDPMVF